MTVSVLQWAKWDGNSGAENVRSGTDITTFKLPESVDVRPP
jgi:hypothetical protein